MLIREYELFSPLLAFSVVDNVVLLHQRQASVAVLLDVASQSSESVGSPLPLTEVLSTTNNGESSSSVSIRKFSAKWNFFLPNVIVDEKGKMYRAQVCYLDCLCTVFPSSCAAELYHLSINGALMGSIDSF